MERSALKTFRVGFVLVMKKEFVAKFVEASAKLFELEVRRVFKFVDVPLNFSLCAV